MIIFAAKDGVNYHKVEWACDGTDSTIVANRQCQVPITTFTESPFLLDWGDTVSVKVSATNDRGTSPVSPAGSGGLIVTSPDTPINLVKDHTNTDSQQISITWQQGPTFYGASVIDYQLSYDEGNADDVFVVLADNIVATSYVLTGI